VHCDLWRRACNSKPSMANHGPVQDSFGSKVEHFGGSGESFDYLTPSRVPYPKRRSIASVEGGPRIAPNLITLVLEPEASCRLPSGNFPNTHGWLQFSWSSRAEPCRVSKAVRPMIWDFKAGALRKALLRCFASCQCTPLFLMTPR
jgi:hypothetical protein